jgi:hypothetical protein
MLIKAQVEENIFFWNFFFAGLGCGDHQEKNSEKPD